MSRNRTKIGKKTPPGKTVKFQADGGTYKLREGLTPGGRKYDAYSDSDGRARITVQGRGAGGTVHEKRRVKTPMGDAVEKTSQKWGETPKRGAKGPTKPVGGTKSKSGPAPDKMLGVLKKHNWGAR